ncbi:MAG: hypothetical protein EAZ97_00890 [Bacteroidetes bacterium]|nr:MAG: hypothetical protein EAZ97_00890 [Bacteroidota bacterium]
MASKKPNKSFKDWQAEEVEKTFGITKKRTLPILETLKKVKLPENHELRETLETYRLEAFDYIESWNEDEYKFFFISPFFKLVNFLSPHYKAFTQRPLSVKYDNDTKITNGNVEFMLAKGRQIPEIPHFFLHEYKPEKNRDNDPLGQLLIAMVAAQKLNQDEKAIYGIYVNGRNWFLVALEGKKYATSNPYVVSSNDIFDLFAVLLFFKQEMETLYSQL